MLHQHRGRPGMAASLIHDHLSCIGDCPTLTMFLLAREKVALGIRSSSRSSSAYQYHRMPRSGWQVLSPGMRRWGGCSRSPQLQWAAQTCSRCRSSRTRTGTPGCSAAAARGVGSERDWGQMHYRVESGWRVCLDNSVGAQQRQRRCRSVPRVNISLQMSMGRSPDRGSPPGLCSAGRAGPPPCNNRKALHHCIASSGTCRATCTSPVWPTAASRTLRLQWNQKLEKLAKPAAPARVSSSAWHLWAQLRGTHSERKPPWLVEQQA